MPLQGVQPWSGVGTGIGTASIITAAIWARVKVGELARKADQNRWQITYYKIGPGRVYVGRCSGYGKTIMDKAVNGSVYARIEKKIAPFYI